MQLLVYILVVQKSI